MLHIYIIRYLKDNPSQVDEIVEKQFPSRFAAFEWAWDFSNGRRFTVRPFRHAA